MRIEDFDNQSPSAISAELERILGSDAFHGCEKLSRFLRVIVDRTLRGEAELLKEHLIGVEVLGRKPSFDPRMDSIVRVEAGRLRSRLKHYYDTEGASAGLRIELPKGGYVPRFIRPATPAATQSKAEPKIDSTPVLSSIAVLPFADRSQQRDQEYFCEGMTEEVINALTRVSVLRVIAWSPIDQFRSHALDRDSLSSLDVATVLEGSIRKAGDRLRISAHLITVHDSRYIWSETYDRKLEDVFTIQEEIANAIVDALRVRFEPELESPLVRRSTADIDAYKLYLKGRHHWNRRSPSGLERSIEFFQRAIGKDPQYALAYAGLADAYSLLANYGAAPPFQARESAKHAALKAVAIDHTLAEAHCSLAHVRATYDWDWAGAEGEFEQALELNPRYATGHHWYAMTVLAPLGDMQRALVEIGRARDLDPISLSVNRDLAVIHFFQRLNQAAVEQSRYCIKLDPTFEGGYWTLGLALEQQGDFGEAIQAFRVALKLSNGLPRMFSALGHAFGVSGDRQRAQEILNELEALASRQYVSPFEPALVHLGLDDSDQTFAWLDQACHFRCYELVSLRTDPRYDPIRADSRFLTLLEKVGLPVS